MADNQHVNKVVYGNTVLIDLTADTVTADKILASYTAHDATGNTVTGTCDFDVNSQDANVKVAEILNGKTAYARGTKLVGTMPNNGSVSILDTEKAKLIAANIKQGITILGVTGTLEPSSSVKVHAKSVTPKTTSQTILPGEGFDYLSQVNVAAIPYVETDNSAGGKTVTIAGEG